MARKIENLEPKPDLRSWCVHLLPHWPEQIQLPRLTGIIYKPSSKVDARALLISSIRPGSILEVYDAFLLALTFGRSDVRFRDLVAVMDQVEERGGTIRELSTGYETPKDRRKMRDRARQMIIDHARGRKSAENGKLSTGAPQIWPRSGPVYEGYRTIWESRRYTNLDERRTAIIKRFGKAPSGVWLRQRFGSPHGKQAGGKA